MATLQVNSEAIIERETAFLFGQNEGASFADCVAFFSGINWTDKEHVDTLSYEYRLGYVVGRGIDGRKLDRDSATRILTTLTVYRADKVASDKMRTHAEQSLYDLAKQAWYRVKKASGAPVDEAKSRGAKNGKAAKATEPEAQTEPSPVAIHPLQNPQEAVFALGGVDSIAEVRALHNQIAALISAAMARFAKAYPAEYRDLDMDYCAKVKKLASGITGDAVKPVVESKPIPVSVPSAKALRRAAAAKAGQPITTDKLYA